MTMLQQNTKPELAPWLLLEITTECNLRCKHCLLWTTKEGPAALGTERKLALLAEFAEWKGSGKVVLSGGEVFLKSEEVLRLAARCRELGLHSTALTNATLMGEAEIAGIVDSGLSQICISLDAPTPELYDYSRGVAGTHAKAVQAIRALVARRKEAGTDLRIVINTILTRGALPHLPEHFQFLRGLGVDGVFVFPLEPTFAIGERPDPFYEREHLRPEEATRAAFAWLLEQGEFITNERADLLACRDHIFAGTVPACAAGERNLIVDLDGNARLCHSMEQRISEGKALGNVRAAGLRELFSSAAADEYRNVMQSCRESCANLNCNRPTLF